VGKRWEILDEFGFTVATGSDRSLAWLNFRNAREPATPMAKFAACHRRLGYRAFKADGAAPPTVKGPA